MRVLVAEDHERLARAVAAGLRRHGMTVDVALVRQYLPRLTDLSVHTQGDLNKIARSLNTRPRQTLGWMTPSQVFARAVGLTA